MIFRLTILSLLITGSLSSCVTARKCLDKFGQDTIKVTVRDTISVSFDVPVSADSVEGLVNEDSIRMLLNGTIDSLSSISESGKLSVKVWRDKYTRLLNYKSKVDRDTIVMVREVPIEVEANCPSAVVVDAWQVLRWYEKMWKHFQLFSAYLVLAGLLIILVRIVLKRLV